MIPVGCHQLLDLPYYILMISTSRALSWRQFSTYLSVESVDSKLIHNRRLLMDSVARPTSVMDRMRPLCPSLAIGTNPSYALSRSSADFRYITMKTVAFLVAALASASVRINRLIAQSIDRSNTIVCMPKCLAIYHFFRRLANE